MNKRIFLQMLGVAAACPAWAAQATSLRDLAGKPIRVVVPLPAGSSNDYATRVLMTQVGKSTGLTFVVDNKPGANGVIGMMDVVRAQPDGLTLACASNSPLAANVAFVKNLPYDLQRDLTPVAAVSLTNHVLMVKNDSPIKTLADFIAYAKQRPGKVSVGYSTASVQTQIATMNKQAGIDLLPIPYKGSPATITDVIGGVLDATLTDPGNALSQVRGNNLRALAVSSLQRNPVTPDWPAISETLSGFDFPSWNAIVGPAGLPQTIAASLAEAVRTAQQQKEVIDAYAIHGTVPLIKGPDELKGYVVQETQRWVKAAQLAGIQPE